MILNNNKIWSIGYLIDYIYVNFSEKEGIVDNDFLLL